MISFLKFENCIFNFFYHYLTFLFHVVLSIFAAKGRPLSGGNVVMVSLFISSSSYFLFKACLLAQSAILAIELAIIDNADHLQLRNNCLRLLLILFCVLLAFVLHPLLIINLST